jgi:hypothetical protein
MHPNASQFRRRRFFLGRLGVVGTLFFRDFVITILSTMRSYSDEECQSFGLGRNVGGDTWFWRRLGCNPFAYSSGSRLHDRVLNFGKQASFDRRDGLR